MRILHEIEVLHDPDTLLNLLGWLGIVSAISLVCMTRMFYKLGYLRGRVDALDEQAARTVEKWQKHLEDVSTCKVTRSGVEQPTQRNNN